MNLSLFASNLEMLANSKNGMNLLRTLILDMALSGKLSEHKIEFESKLLGDIAAIRTGKLDANASSEDGIYPFFTCAKDPLRISSFTYDTECVLLAGNGNFDVNYYSGKFDAYQRTYILEPKNKEDLYVPFLYRFMQSHSRKLTEQSIGGVIKYLKIGFLTSAPIKVPSFKNQESIVKVIDSLMSICDEIELRIENQESICKSARLSAISAMSTAQTPEHFQIAWKRIEQNWEVIASTSESIEPLRNLILSSAVTGNLTHGYYPQDSVEELLENVSETINPYPEMSEKRFAIPPHWKWVSLASIAEHQLGKMLQSSRIEGVRTKYLRTANLKSDGSIDLSHLKEMFIPESEISKYSVLKGDIFVNEGGEVGRSAIYQGESSPGLAFQNHLHRLRAAQGIENQYIQLVLKQAKNHGVIATMSSGVTIQNFSANSLRRLAIPLPPLSEQKLIIDHVNQLMKICDELENGMLGMTDIAEKFAQSVVSVSP